MKRLAWIVTDTEALLTCNNATKVANLIANFSMLAFYTSFVLGASIHYIEF
jgi:hypothetical protein